tara:strand:+ start:7620 stop:8804 length:1185 start_codon:yes stop_codon:yes gene_type:complete
MTDVSTEIENEDVTDFGALSDEEFIQSFEPSMDEDASLPAQAADEVTDEADVAPVTDPAVPAEAAPKADGEPSGEGAVEAGAAVDEPTPRQTTPEGEAPAEEAAEDKDPADPVVPETDYKNLYEKMMAPFKANGKEFKPSNPEEAVRLMQMGANYTKKMQALQPNLKLMRMLENNNLLDESKLSYLIDLEQKNPQAIQKLLRDGNIDPLDLDLSAEPAYSPGDHAVSDNEMAFHDALANVRMTSTGTETIQHINSQWDQESKQALYREPVLLNIIDEQRANGVYGRISAEIDRERVLGNLPNMSFLQAYRHVGDRLFAAQQLQPEAPQPVNPAPAPQAPQVLDTRPAMPKPAAANGDKARAISSAPRSKPAPAASFDPFAMSDEQIMALNSIPV